MCGGRSSPAPTPPPAPAPPMQAIQLDPSQDAETAQKKKQKAKSSGTKKYRNPVMSNMSINTGTTGGGSGSVGGLNIS